MTLHQLFGAFPLQPPARGGQAARFPPAFIVGRRQLRSWITAHAVMIAPWRPLDTGITSSGELSTRHQVGRSRGVAVSGATLAAAALDAGHPTVVQFAMSSSAWW